MIRIYDVWAEWCPPCKKFAPIFEAVKSKYENDQLEFVKKNVEEDPEFLHKFRIMNIPTILATDQDGKILYQQAGIMNSQEFENLVFALTDKYLL